MKPVLSCAQDAQAQQVEVGATVHRALEQFETVDLAFDWPVTPRLLKCREEGVFVALKIVGKIGEWASSGGCQPSLPRSRIFLRGPGLGVIDAILDDDKQRPVKQRHTSKRIFERLKEEHGFTGGYTIVKDYVRAATLRRQEVFVPLVHPAGEAQVDFGEVLVVVAGVEHKAHYLAMDLPHSDDCFVAAFPAETTEAFLEGHARAFAYFGGVPTRILYDNTKIAVAKILHPNDEDLSLGTPDPGRRAAATDAVLI